MVENNKYVLGTDTFDNKVFSVCLFDAENNTLVISENIVGEKEFEERVEDLTKQYNCSRAEEYETKEPTKKRVYGRIPNISEAMKTFLTTEKGKQVLVKYFLNN